MAGQCKVVRVTGLPPVGAVEAERLLRDAVSGELQEDEQGVLSFQVSIVSSCAANDASLVALLDFNDRLPAFLAVLDEGSFRERKIKLDEEGNIIYFDVHFLGFTQLYPATNPDNPTLDIIAITGLDGHAYGSWQSRDDVQQMWLRHWLSKDLPSCRTMIYGYKSKLSGISTGTIEEYAIELMGWIQTIRDNPNAQRRPLVFIAHSLGGLIIARMLVKASLASDDGNIAIASLYRATYAIIFFAVPHRGLDVEDMRNIINEKGSPMGPLVDQIDVDSKQLTMQLVDFKDVLQDRRIISLYEAEQSRRLQKNKEGEWKRTGEYYQSLQKDSAVLQLPRQMETAIRVEGNHSSIARFSNRYTSKYPVVLEQVRLFEQNASEVVQARFLQLGARIEPTAINLLARDLRFIDRPDIFVKLDAAFDLSEPHSRAALIGLGGIGKSQIAIEYAHRFRARKKMSWAFFVHANSTATFMTSFRAIAKALDIPGHEDEKTDILDLVSCWLGDERNGSWLVIVDNADDMSIMRYRYVHKKTSTDEVANDGRQLRDYLPQSAHGRLLVTSRDREAAHDLVGNYRAIVEVGVMSQEESLALLQTRTEVRSEDEESAQQLVVALGKIPLAVSQAGAYIERQKSLISIAGYLEEFTQSSSAQQSLLNVNHNELRRNPEVPNSVVATWEITFRQIRRQQPDAADLLALLAMYHHQRIPKPLAVPSIAISNFELRERLAILEGFALLIISMGTDASAPFSMHALVQLATRAWLKVESRLNEYAQLAIKKVDGAFKYCSFDNRDACNLIMPHAHAVTKHTEVGFIVPVKGVSILLKMSHYFEFLGLFEQAITTAKEGLDACKQLDLAEDDDTYLQVLTGLAFSLSSQGRWDEAERLEVQVIERREIKLGEDHPDTLLSIANLACTYRDRGRWEEAEKLLVYVIERRSITLGQDHVSTLTSVANLASTYRNQGRWEEAEKLQIQVIAAKKIKLGGDHLSTLTDMANLASSYNEQGRWKEAERLQEQVAERRKTKLGEDHPDTLTAISQLASIYSRQGKLKEAEVLQEQAMGRQKAKLGEDHPDTLTSMANLASTYWNQGKFNEAEELEEQAMERQKAKLGEDHPDTLTSMANLACTYRDQKKLEQAEKLEVQVMERRKTVLGADHPDTLTVMANLATTYSKQRRLEEAEKLEVQVMERSKAKLGENHPNTLLSMANLAVTYYLSRKRILAFLLMEKAIQRMGIHLGSSHPMTQNYQQIWQRWQETLKT